MGGWTASAVRAKESPRAHIITAYPKLEWTHKDYQAQSLTLHRTTQKSNPMSESAVQTLTEFHQLEAVINVLGSLFHANCSLVENFFLPSSPPAHPPTPLAQLHAVPSGPVAVTESRAQRCPLLPVRNCSHHEASPQLLCSGPNAPRGLRHSLYILLVLAWANLAWAATSILGSYAVLARYTHFSHSCMFVNT